MSHEKGKALLEKYHNGTATAEEKALLERWLIQFNEVPVEFTDEHIEEISQEVWARLPKSSESKIIRLSIYARIAIAASLLLFISAGGYYFLHNSATKQQKFANDIAPGSDKLILTLSNGKKVDLTSATNGQVAVQSGATINKSANKQIIYSSISQNAQSNEVNTVSAPRGGKGSLVLSDGTKVWLNSESSITFPVAFTGKERIVKLIGEAYFDVKHMKARPFKVETANLTIEDIGTGFNVNAYTDEPKTLATLIEGSIKINGITLTPGQQTDGTKVTSVNTDQFIAWKNNDFDFEGDHIDVVMRQLSRWYDIQVVWDGPMTNDVFYAPLTRTHPLSDVLKILEKTNGVHFKVEGRRVIVSR